MKGLLTRRQHSKRNPQDLQPPQQSLRPLQQPQDQQLHHGLATSSGSFSAEDAFLDRCGAQFAIVFHEQSLSHQCWGCLTLACSIARHLFKQEVVLVAACTLSYQRLRQFHLFSVVCKL